MIDLLVEALRAEFSGEVSFLASYPSQISAPAVIVTPGDPFLENDTHGAIRETWHILAAASQKEPRRGVETMRDLSLRVRRASSSVGALWDRAEGPRRLSPEDSQTVISINRISFKYVPTEEA